MAFLPKIPDELEAVFRQFRTCEFSTFAKDGTPVTWPIEPFYQVEKGSFFITASIGLAQKVFNVRRDRRVALLFSDPTGSDLVDPPAVLVQGDAEAPDRIITSFTGELAESGRLAFQKQPAAELYSSNPLMRYLFDWYYMRLIITVKPRRIRWWEHRDFSLAPRTMEVGHVG